MLGALPAARAQAPGEPAPPALSVPTPEIAAEAAPTGTPALADGIAPRGHPPSTPAILSVTADPKTPLTRFYTLLEPFTDPDGPPVPTATDWQIETAPPPPGADGVVRTVYRSAAGAPPGAPSDLLLLPPGVLARDGRYTARVRFRDRDGNWSAWSRAAPVLLPPPPAVNPVGPPAPPRLIRFKAESGTVRAMGELTRDDLAPAHRPDGSFLYGLAALCINDLAPGATASVIYMLPGRAPAGARWVHHHPGTGLTDRTERVRINGETIIESLTDGGEGDADGAANGVILATVGLLLPGVPE